MADSDTKNNISSNDKSIAGHNFHPLNPDSRVQTEGNVEILDSGKDYSKKEEEKAHSKMSSDATIFGATFMMTNMCLGTTIFTFAVRAKSFGLIWILVACFAVAAIDYWSIMNCAVASSKVKVDDFSEVTEQLLGKKARTTLNILIIVYSYACMMCFYVLIFALFGRFIQSVAYSKEYPNYEDFFNEKWGKPYIKFPFAIGIAFCLGLMSLIKDISKLNFSAYIGVGAVIYTLFVIMIECHKYYTFYKEHEYIAEDKNTHLNLVDLSKAFTKDLDFFKGMACIFGAYACHTGVFPVYSGFKYQENGLRKMKFAVFFSVCLTTALHIVSIICSYLTEPIKPEDVIIYRKQIGDGKDVAMTISKLFVTLSLVFTLPGYFFGLRLSIANSFTGGNISRLFNIIFTFVSMFVCAFIAAIYDKVLNYLSYIGGFITVFVCYLYPALLHIYSTQKPLLHWRNLFDLIFSIILCIIGVIAGIRTIIDDVQA